LAPNSPEAHDVTVASIVLENDSDLVAVVRRTRTAGADLGLILRDIRGLSAAAYEMGRLLLQCRGGRAEISVGQGPTLEVAYLYPAGAAACGLVEQLTQAAEPLRGLVASIQIERTSWIVRVCLRTELSRGTAAAPSTAAPPPPPIAPVEHLSPNDVEGRYAALQHAFRSLQSELHDTNRGVVALHAELEAQADRLRTAEDRLKLLLDSVQDYAICMLTPNGDVESWNAGAERLFGYAAEDIIGRGMACFYAEADRDTAVAAEHLRVARDRGRAACECLQVRQDGTTFDAHVVLTAVQRRGELRGFAFVVRDVTERKRLEEDLRRRADDLAAANRAKEDFLATLSHELRTPLNAMLGWTRLLRVGRLDEAGMLRALETIERNARIQEQLIADILDVSRIVTGKLRLEFRPVELLPIVEAALDAVRPAALAKRVALTLDAGGAATVLGDPDRLQQVIWNLLVNAIKFTPPEGYVSIATAVAGGTAVLTVSDSGEGIPAEFLPVIFDRFAQGDASATRPHGGLGLGLSIVRHIVELHGGGVRAHSEGVGQGATFTVHLPVRAVRQAAAASRDQPLTGVKVLIVDDDPDAREVVSVALAECGAQPAAAASAREALRVLEEVHPDVLVSDIGMPGEDGLSLIKRVRALDSRLAAVPAVALTAYAGEDDERRALAAGFQRFVAKPVALEELAAVVRQLAPAS